MNAPPLLNALGAFWDFGAPVVAATWNIKGTEVGFALGDGHLAVADSEWKNGPKIELRPEGGVGMVAAKDVAPRPVRVACHPNSCISIAADLTGGFLTGGDDGRVVHVPHFGDPVILAHIKDSWIDSLACSIKGIRAYASGKSVIRMSPEGDSRIEIKFPATTISFSPDGLFLAIAHSGGVTLWGADSHLRQLVWPGYHRGLAWSPDGRYLVSGMQENALHGWRISDGGDIEMGGYLGQPLSLSFSFDGHYIVTSGGTRPICWGFDPPNANDMPVECGIESKTPVSYVSCHPRQSLIATGYLNGAVLLCQPGSNEGLFIKGSGGGAVNVLTWTSDGSRLAFGTQDGVFGWVSLPEALFRSSKKNA